MGTMPGGADAVGGEGGCGTMVCLRKVHSLLNAESGPAALSRRIVARNSASGLPPAVELCDESTQPKPEASSAKLTEPSVGETASLSPRQQSYAGAARSAARRTSCGLELWLVPARLTIVYSVSFCAGSGKRLPKTPSTSTPGSCGSHPLAPTRPAFAKKRRMVKIRRIASPSRGVMPFHEPQLDSVVSKPTPLKKEKCSASTCECDHRPLRCSLVELAVADRHRLPVHRRDRPAALGLIRVLAADR
mmetsp:Transcript_41561/g.137733  ORF Transcript_41561/g.137733 Transcript_41561/m.137733 type:complete len:247 (-) Transcript_41561:376-1116(-)